jgi:hypothetical protein
VYEFLQYLYQFWCYWLLVVMVALEYGVRSLLQDKLALVVSIIEPI